ncbi:hypothetical protein VF14_23575 [Nostoc linckia z18]|uniref:DUF6745 domain-containing protein n=2 Tax=Nostoc linckia TaxID=92942 RepID=A0A9Q5ZDB9_NOSLI|nr:hypothetical protein VF02_19665 [Nostoc linckia z1]PHJ64249.1 hypothetical protein VF05_22960 [Nostoc linckia z3]PHJ71884.1 hypothetical protein VF03_19510 [Nostoc linckia z2]PHJ79959.1 hypothetical protein VF06_24285 [Nostoc linckia z4]PHJ92767.1 hypothetical protein VF07_00045 [Nostoc linckia z6]PHJ97009.1 hypothetical protein VF04_13820 [Nostoc linckia z7]PHK04527.1 hypothetical protein VF08_10995 [Nostoc linckia z8]PHK11150.1 hypothetical protein VF09_08510 [Nostoc linckia z9]PHK1986
MIEKLTPEQEALIPVYREKWRKIALSTERIDREKAAEVVKAAYKSMDFDEPKILFYDSPYAALKEFMLQLDNSLFNQKAYKFREKFLFPILDEIENQIANKELEIFIKQEIIVNSILDICDIYAWILSKEFDQSLYIFYENFDLSIYNLNYISPELLLGEVICIDFCISELKWNVSQQLWLILQNLMKNCGWIFPDKNIAIICDRPLHLRFDNQNRLHAEGEPAIEYADGFSLYSYHGVTLPEKYGKVHPKQWQPQWLLSEENAELRRVLIQGIGYARICQELQAIELDTWAEYTLLKIDADVDEEPIYLLKMVCPSTGFIHALRVPPNINSAREAIRWVNWGVDAEEFGVQT